VFTTLHFPVILHRQFSSTVVITEKWAEQHWKWENQTRPVSAQQLMEQ
jgi:hypothetical protein